MKKLTLFLVGSLLCNTTVAFDTTDIPIAIGSVAMICAMIGCFNYLKFGGNERRAPGSQRLLELNNARAHQSISRSELMVAVPCCCAFILALVPLMYCMYLVNPNAPRDMASHL